MNDLAQAAVSELRRAFDEAFATAARTERPDLEDVLALRVSGQPYALSVGDLSGIAKTENLAPLPGPAPELLGVVGIRGTLAPVYSLARLLGYGQQEDRATWLALCGGREPLALAFGELEGYFRVPNTDLDTPQTSAGLPRHVKRVLRLDATMRYVIDVGSVVAAIKGEAGSSTVGGPE